MAIDKRLQIYDEQGNLVDYDILASDVKFLPDGKDLPTKLAEMQDEIGEGGYTPPQGGIPKTDLAPSVQTSLDKADSAYQKPASGIPASDIADGVIPDTSNLATKTELAGKVDKNGTDSLMTTAEHTKLAGIAAGAQVNTINSISVNGTTQSPVDGNVDISVEGAAGEDGITPHIGSNGNWWIGPETDPTNDTGIKAQGPQGSVTITDGNLNSLEVHNALNANTGILGMGGAMRIKSNIDLLYTSLNRLYSKLANIAFLTAEDKTAAAPTHLDWNVPKKTLTVTNGIANSKVMYDGSELTTSIQVDMGSTVSLLVVGATGYVITSVTASGATVIDNEDGTFTVSVTVSDTMTLAITGNAAATVQVSIVTSNATGALAITPSSTIVGGTFVGEISNVDDAYDDFEITSVKDASNNSVTYTLDDNEITIEDVPSAITITAVAKQDKLRVWFGQSLDQYGVPVNDTDACYTDFIKLDGLSASSTMAWTYNLPKDSSNQWERRNLIFYDSNKRIMFYDFQWNTMWQPVEFSANANNSRTLTTTNLDLIFSKAGQNTPVYCRASFAKTGSAITSGCGLVQGSTNFVDISNVRAAAAEETTHSVTVNTTHCSWPAGDSTFFSRKMVHGHALELAFKASSGYTTSNISFIVSMGGVDISSQVSSKDETIYGTAYKIVVIENITGDIIINASV